MQIDLIRIGEKEFDSAQGIFWPRILAQPVRKMIFVLLLPVYCLRVNLPGYSLNDFFAKKEGSLICRGT
jgi:hypothetical protein